MLNPKKRWIEQAAAASTSTSSEVLARPIRWGEDEENQLRIRSQQERMSRRSPKSLIVATALVELASDSSPSKSESGSTSGPVAAADQNQPLNLSVNSR